MNSPGGYVYILYGEDTFGRDEAVLRLKEKIRELPAGDHNLTEFGPETSVAALRLAADVVPFLADRRMVLVRGPSPDSVAAAAAGDVAPRVAKPPCREMPGRVPDSAGVSARPAPDQLARGSLWRTVSGPTLEPLAAVIPSGRAAIREAPRVTDVLRWVRARPGQIEVELDEGRVRELAMLRRGTAAPGYRAGALADYAAGRGQRGPMCASWSWARA